MNRLLGILQIVLSVACLLIAAATAVNLVFIATRPDSISVVNVLIGQTLLIVCFIALGRILMKRGLRRLRQ